MDLEEKITNLELSVKTLDTKLQLVNDKLDKILGLLETDCKKMTDHIDFIEQVYDNVKNPLNFIMNKVNNLRGSSQEPLTLC